VANCTGSDDITGCVMANCLEPFSALASGCTQCLAANLSKPLEEIFATCTASGAVMSYDGRNGLILLAHREFDTTEHLVLDSFLLRRVVLHATFKNDPDNTHVFCTHLSAPLSEMEYAGKYESWEAEQAAQIDQMVAWIDTQAGTDPTVLLGDMNCGPAADGVSAALPENYEKLVSAGGFIDVYMVALAPECTWCASNTLVDDGNDNQIIDHVLVRSFAMDEVPVAERFLDQLVEVTVDGQPQQTNLSDHFGVWWH
jgi:endonuclease/exonuclease/phosphatase family metal-dependent hydrolase